jgi:hypothetical protein
LSWQNSEDGVLPWLRSCQDSASAGLASKLSRQRHPHFGLHSLGVLECMSWAAFR